MRHPWQERSAGRRRGGGVACEAATPETAGASGRRATYDPWAATKASDRSRSAQAREVELAEPGGRRAGRRRARDRCGEVRDPGPATKRGQAARVELRRDAGQDGSCAGMDAGAPSAGGPYPPGAGRRSRGSAATRAQRSRDGEPQSPRRGAGGGIKSSGRDRPLTGPVRGRIAAKRYRDVPPARTVHRCRELRGLGAGRLAMARVGVLDARQRGTGLPFSSRGGKTINS